MSYFIDTTPSESMWEDLYATDDYHIRVLIRATAKPTTDNWMHNIDLTKYYDYCKISDINLIGHTIDVIGSNERCVLSLYFASIADKAHFILKFK